VEYEAAIVAALPLLTALCVWAKEEAVSEESDDWAAGAVCREAVESDVTDWGWAKIHWFEEAEVPEIELICIIPPDITE
jgi:hypothetical protein